MFGSAVRTGENRPESGRPRFSCRREENGIPRDIAVNGGRGGDAGVAEGDWLGFRQEGRKAVGRPLRRGLYGLRRSDLEGNKVMRYGHYIIVLALLRILEVSKVLVHMRMASTGILGNGI